MSRKETDICIVISGFNQLDNFCSVYKALNARKEFRIFIIFSSFNHPAFKFEVDYLDKFAALGVNKEMILNTDEVTFIIQTIKHFIFLNPYVEALEPKIQNIFKQKNIIKYYIPYGISVNYFPVKKICKSFDIIFCESPKIKAIVPFWYRRKFIPTGLPKLDAFFDTSLQTHNEVFTKLNKLNKTILIIEHHSIDWYDQTVSKKKGKGYSKFIKYMNLYLTLPQQFPNINFIFRPHPLMFPALLKAGLISSEQIEDFIKEFEHNTNAIYSSSSEIGNYIDVFIKCDGLISSGVSSLFEFLPSGKPVLFLEKEDGDGFNAYGKLFLQCFYKAKNEQDILNFLSEVILKGNDMLLKKRGILVKESILLPNSGAGNEIADYFLKNLKKNSPSIFLVFKKLKMILSRLNLSRLNSRKSDW